MTVAVDNDVPSGKDKEYRQWSHSGVPQEMMRLSKSFWILNTFLTYEMHFVILMMALLNE